MILVDTSIWINFLRAKNHKNTLSELLLQNQLLCHAWIIGELMLGDLGPKRRQILTDLALLPKVDEYPIEEMGEFVQKEHLYGKGLSLVDTQLLYACLVENRLLWTDDRVLQQSASRYNISWEEPI